MVLHVGWHSPAGMHRSLHAAHLGSICDPTRRECEIPGHAPASAVAKTSFHGGRSQPRGRNASASHVRMAPWPPPCAGRAAPVAAAAAAGGWPGRRPRQRHALDDVAMSQHEPPSRFLDCFVRGVAQTPFSPLVPAYKGLFARICAVRPGALMQQPPRGPRAADLGWARVAFLRTWPFSKAKAPPGSLEDSQIWQFHGRF